MIPPTTVFSVETPQPSRALRVGLWAAQIFLAVGFAASGAVKATQPIDMLVQGMQMRWVSAVPEALVRLIGVAELLGAAGLLLPSLTRIRPRLTPAAAVALALLMVLAAGFHASRQEAFMVPVNVLLGGLAVFVAWGRLTRAPLPARDIHG